MKIWSCKIGETLAESLPRGADFLMREAVERAYEQVTGRPATFTFSRWGAKLTENERAAVGRWTPGEQEPISAGIAQHIEMGAATLWDWMHEDSGPRWDDPEADPHAREAARGCVGMILAATNILRRERELRQEIALLKSVIRGRGEVSHADQE